MRQSLLYVFSSAWETVFALVPTELLQIYEKGRHHPRSYRGRRGAAYFLRAYAGAPVTRTLRFLLASLRRASGLTP